MIHSTFLIDLRKEASTKLMFYPPHQDYTWSFDDIMVFAFSSRQAGMSGTFAGEGSLVDMQISAWSLEAKSHVLTSVVSLYSVPLLFWIYARITNKWLAMQCQATASFRGHGSNSWDRDNVSESKYVSSVLDLCCSKAVVNTGECCESGSLFVRYLKSPLQETPGLSLDVAVIVENKLTKKLVAYPPCSWGLGSWQLSSCTWVVGFFVLKQSQYNFQAVLKGNHSQARVG